MQIAIIICVQCNIYTLKDWKIEQGSTHYIETHTCTHQNQNHCFTKDTALHLCLPWPVSVTSSYEVDYVHRAPSPEYHRQCYKICLQWSFLGEICLCIFGVPFLAGESRPTKQKFILNFFFFIRKGTFEIKLKICRNGWAVELTGASMQISKQFLSYSIIAAYYISAIRHVTQTIKNKHASLNGAPGLSRIIILVSDA